MKGHVSICLSTLPALASFVGTLHAGEASFFNDVRIPMRDGVCLAGDVYLPSNRADKVGCWLVFSPYSATKGDGPKGVKRAEEWGVAAMSVDCRGLCQSEGTFDAWDPGLVDDADDLLNWIAAQPWSDGRVVMTGGSYPGNTQLAALRSGNPHLVACAPSVVTFDPYTINFQNGVLIPQFFRDWHSNLAGSNAWERMSCHAARDDYWTKRADLRNLAKSRARAFYQAGWFDMLGIATFETFARLPEGSVLRIGPWSHGVDVFDNPEVDYSKLGGKVTEDAEIEFLRSALAGTTSASRDWPGRILLYTMGRNEWRCENAWPLERTVWRDHDFTGGRTRSFVHDPANPVPMKGGRLIGAGGQYDQREIERRADVLSFTGDALDADLEVTGPVSAKLSVASTARSSDVTVKLVDVCPDGRALNVLEGICRIAFDPGERKTVAFPLDVTSYVFLKGHRVRVDVAGSCAPHFEVNPNPATITLFAGSSLRLPTIPPPYSKARSDRTWWVERFARNRNRIRACGGAYDIVMLGDSITHYWEVGEGQDDSRDIEILERKYRILNCGYGGDRIENLLWRIENGELDGYKARLVTLMIGTNNRDNRAEEIVRGVRSVIGTIHRKQPEARILLMGYLPCGKGHGGALRVLLDRARPQLRELAEGDSRVIWFDCGSLFLNPDGTTNELLFDKDVLHPSTMGYRVWREALEPVLAQILAI